MTQTVPTKPARGIIATLLSAALLSIPIAGGSAPAAQASNEATTLPMETAVTMGAVPRDIVVDDFRERAYVLNSHVSDSNKPDEVTWLNTADNTPSTTSWPLKAKEPTALQLSPDGSKLYIAHYRNSKFSIVDTETGESEVLDIGTKYPGGIVVDSGSGNVYVYDSKGLILIDPEAKTVSEPIKVSNERYPNVKDVEYDPTNKVLWIAEGRAGVLTAFNLETGKWDESVSVPLSTAEIDGAEIGGRPQLLAYDHNLGLLHISMRARLSENWTNDRVISFDVFERKLLTDRFVEVGANPYEMVVHPLTSEIYTSNGHSNSVSVISPATWQATDAVNFNEIGITEGTGSGNANTWDIAFSGDGDTAYVSHPYKTAKITVHKRQGETPKVTPRDNGAQTPAPPTTPEVTPWDGPATPAVTPASDEAAASAATVTDATLNWAISDYAAAWKTTPLGAVTKTDAVFNWAGGSGWYSEKTGEVAIAWGEGVKIQHYEQLVPDLITTIGNPVLTVNADKTGTLSYDVKWTLSPDTKSDGYKRVPLATFKDVVIKAENGTVSVTATPEWEGREYELADGTKSNASYPAEFINYLDPQMRPWWYRTGASMDAAKTPLPVTFTFTAAAAPAAPAQPQQPAQPAQPVDPAQPAQPADQANPADQAKLSQPVPEQPKQQQPEQPAKQQLAVTGGSGELLPGAGAMLLAAGVVLIAARFAAAARR